MLSSTRILTSRVVVKRALSSGVTSSNRLAIAQALLRAKTIRTAKDEAALKAAIVSSPKIDTHHLPAELSEFGNYLSSGGAAASAPFVADPNAWQNKVWWKFMLEEYSRPFQILWMVGGSL